MVRSSGDAPTPSAPEGSPDTIEVGMRDDKGGGDETAPRANILLVDDQPANLLALEAVLTDLGQNLVSVRSGDDALRCSCNRTSPSSSSTSRCRDSTASPPPSSSAAASEAATRQSFSSPPTTPPISRSSAYELGAVDYLVKPIVSTILRAKAAVFVDLFQKTERLPPSGAAEFERLLEEAARREAEEGRPAQSEDARSV